jgi:hypothetical protein
MRRNGDLLDSLYPLPDHLDNLGKFLRHGVTHGVGNIQGRRARFHNGIENFAQKVWIGASGVFRRKLDVLAE